MLPENANFDYCPQNFLKVEIRVFILLLFSNISAREIKYFSDEKAEILQMIYGNLVWDELC